MTPGARWSWRVLGFKRDAFPCLSTAFIFQFSTFCFRFDVHRSVSVSLDLHLCDTKASENRSGCLHNRSVCQHSLVRTGMPLHCPLFTSARRKQPRSETNTDTTTQSPITHRCPSDHFVVQRGFVKREADAQRQKATLRSFAREVEPRARPRRRPRRRWRSEGYNPQPGDA